MTASIKDLATSDVIQLKGPAAESFVTDGGVESIEHGGWPRKRLSTAQEQEDVLPVLDDEDILGNRPSFEQVVEEIIEQTRKYRPIVERAVRWLDGVVAWSRKREWAPYLMSDVCPQRAAHHWLLEDIIGYNRVQEPCTPGCTLQEYLLRDVLPSPQGKVALAIRHGYLDVPSDDARYCTVEIDFEHFDS